MVVGQPNSTRTITLVPTTPPFRSPLPKPPNRRDDIGTAALEPAVRAFAVADPAPVEAKHRMARRRHALRQHRHPAMRAAANLVAARHDQQPGAAGRIVERRGERRALAIEIQLMLHVRSEEHMSALPSLMRISSAVLCLKTKTILKNYNIYTKTI